MDNQGRVVTAEGNLVQPTITIPPNSSGLTINAQGQVSVTLPGSTTSSILGQFTADDVHQQCRPAGQRQQFVRRDAGLGHAARRPRGANNAGTLLQGSLEHSNVEAVTEISNLISRNAPTK